MGSLSEHRSTLARGARRLPQPPLAPSAAPDAGRALLEQLWGRLGQLDRTAEGGQSSLAAALVVQAQREHRPTAWIQPTGGGVYPPDLQAAGVDVAALAVLHVGGAHEGAARLKAAEWLLMQGAFGLVVVDLNDGAPSGVAWQGRLLQLLRQYHSAAVLLTQQPAELPSLGALVSLRFAAHPSPGHLAPTLVGPRDDACAVAGGAGRLPEAAFDLDVTIRKSKAGFLPDRLSLARRAPAGMS